ncbi:hypothetical protein [Alkalinema sp. FACHB-956]|uniref:hypothetical protein n=1 Tax=Alkalinema sp. FACHB-956 TaxID=2692768 RepID=UPI001684086F|nr:hypothetical protein [Alkalinema sp. FACHB-956]
MLSGTVAMLREEKKRASSSFGFSLAALIISILTFGLNAGLKIREEISKLDQTNIQQPTQSIERKDK